MSVVLAPSLEVGAHYIPGYGLDDLLQFGEGNSLVLHNAPKVSIPQRALCSK